MKPYCHEIIENSYLGGEILRSSSKCRNWAYKVIFGGAEKIGCQWKVNFILTYICLAPTQECICQGASSANMYVTAEPGQNIRFEQYLGISKKESVHSSHGNLELCDRFFAVKSIKLVEIETDRILYEIHLS